MQRKSLRNHRTMRPLVSDFIVIRLYNTLASTMISSSVWMSENPIRS